MKVSFSSLLHTKWITLNANILNDDFRKKTNIIHWNYIKNSKISLKSNGPSTSEKIRYFIHTGGNEKIKLSLTRTHLARIFAKHYSNKRSICFFLKNKTLTTIFLAQWVIFYEECSTYASPLPLWCVWRKNEIVPHRMSLCICTTFENLCTTNDKRISCFLSSIRISPENSHCTENYCSNSHHFALYFSHLSGVKAFLTVILPRLTTIKIINLSS